MAYLELSRASWSEFTIQFTTAILCENAHHHADYSSAQWAVTTLVRYATCTVLAESCVSAGHQGKAFDFRLVPTNKLHNTVMVCLQRLAFLVPTLRCQMLVVVVVVVGTVGMLAEL